MNAPNQWYQEDDNSSEENEYQVHMRRESSAPDMKVKRREQSRSKNRPASANGIHRRHNKRWSW